MKIKKGNLRKSASYVAYLMDNAHEIEWNRKHPAAIICGGGGFTKITAREQEPVALYFLNQGFQAFVLNYTLRDTGEATYLDTLYDIAQMVCLIRENADQWAIDPDKICLIGFSAGGSICASLATRWQEASLAEEIGAPSEKIKPNAVILAYPALDFGCQMENIDRDKERDSFMELFHTTKREFLKRSLATVVGKNATDQTLYQASPINYITNQAAPTFIWGTFDDPMIYVEQLLNFAKKMHHANVACELHLFESGPHGLSLANNNTNRSSEEGRPDIALWKDLAMNFLSKHLQKKKKRKFLKKKIKRVIMEKVSK